MAMSLAFMGHSDTTASFVWRRIIALQPSQLPYGAVETKLQRQSEGQKTATGRGGRGGRGDEQEGGEEGGDRQETPDERDLCSVGMWGWREA